METFKELILPIILGFVGGGGLVAIVGYISSKKKTDAEAQNVSITGEISLGKGWQEYAQQQKADKEALRKELTDMLKAQKEDHDRQIAALQKQFDDTLASKDGQIKTLTEKNEELEGRVSELETQLEKYKKTGAAVDEASVKLHQEVDSAAEVIKSNLK